jgi:hypothetical protein
MAGSLWTKVSDSKYFVTQSSLPRQAGLDGPLPGLLPYRSSEVHAGHRVAPTGIGIRQ